MQISQPPQCPTCSFTVFSRRSPKCESCGAELPAQLLYSESDLEALRKSEVERLEHEMQRQKEASKEATATARYESLKIRTR